MNAGSVAPSTTSTPDHDVDPDLGPDRDPDLDPDPMKWLASVLTT